MRATREVEKSISIIETLPSSLLKILLKGSVWYMRNPLEVPRTQGRTRQLPGDQPKENCMEGRDIPTARQLWSWLKVMKLRAVVAMGATGLKDQDNAEEEELITSLSLGEASGPDVP